MTEELKSHIEWANELKKSRGTTPAKCAIIELADALQAAEKRAEEREDYARVITNDLNEQRSRVVRLEADNARLTNNNARLRERIHDLRLGMKFILHEAEYAKNRGSLSKIAWKARLLLKDKEALLPSGNKTPDPQEVDPNGVDYGIFKGDINAEI